MFFGCFNFVNYFSFNNLCVCNLSAVTTTAESIAVATPVLDAKTVPVATTPVPVATTPVPVTTTPVPVQLHLQLRL